MLYLTQGMLRCMYIRECRLRSSVRRTCTHLFSIFELARWVKYMHSNTKKATDHQAVGEACRHIYSYRKAKAQSLG